MTPNDFSEWSEVASIDMFATVGGCGTVPPELLSVPTNLMNPATGSFGEPFTSTWEDVWIGCGGYGAEFRRAGNSSWITIQMPSRNGVELSILLPAGAVRNPTSYALRVRSFWGLRNDTRQFSHWSATVSIEISLSPLRSITFPKLALGGGFEVVLLVSNRANQNWTGNALLKKGNDESWSTPWTLDGKSEAAESAFEISLTAHETQKFLLKGDMEARAGYLSIVPDEGVSASGISVAFFYNFIDGSDVTDSIGVIPGSPELFFPTRLKRPRKRIRG